MPIEGGRQLGLVRVRTVGEDRGRGKLGGDERLVNAVSREGIDESRRVADEERVPASGRRPETPHRQPVSAQAAKPSWVGAVRPCEPREMSAEPRSLLVPPAHAEVGVVSLRKDPAVAAGDDAELHPRRSGVRSGVELSPVRVRLERHTGDDAVPEPGGPGHEPVRPVRADDVGRAHARAGDARDHGSPVGLDPFDSCAVPEVRAGGSGLLGEMEVEPATLRHQDERARAPAGEAAPVPDPEHEVVDHVLDDGRDVAGEMAERPSGQATTAGLVAWEALAVRQQHAGTASSEVDRRGRPRRPRPHDKHVEPLHAAIVRGHRRSETPQSRRPYEATMAPLQGFPSGQRGRAVNPLAQPSEVRILPPALDVERHADRTGDAPSDPRLGPSPSDDEVAREMIARIARQVDLEVGRRPLDAEPQPELEHEPVEDEAVGQVAEARAEASEEPGERSEEDVSRALVERIAREVDEERGG